MKQFEADIIRQFINDDLNRNYNIPPKKYHTVGMTAVTFAVKILLRPDF